MLAKPPACQGCPFYGDGLGFVPDEVPDGAQVIFVAQNPGEMEEAQGRPLVGDTGKRWRTKFVARHIPSAHVGYANLLKCRRTNSEGVKTNELPKIKSAEWWKAVRACASYLDASLAKAPDAWVVLMGAHAAEARTALHGPMLHLRGSAIMEESA